MLFIYLLEKNRLKIDTVKTIPRIPDNVRKHKDTVNNRIPDRPVFQWPFFGQNFGLVFKWSAAILLLLFENQTENFRLA
jgi:hypothetical protein